jgi:hypothetical protein
MVKGYEVLEMLLPNGGWEIKGNDYEGIQFIECEPITKEQFESGFALVEAHKAQKLTEAEAKRQSALDKLAALGLDSEDLKALGF